MTRTTLSVFIVKRWWPLVSSGLHPAWARTVRGHHLSDLIFQIGKRNLMSLTQEDLLKWWRGVCLKRKPKMCNKILVTVKKLFKDAEGWGYVKRSPAATLKPIRVQTPFSYGRFITDSEFTRLEREVSGRVAEYVVLARYTGARRSSLYYLRWEDISFDTGTITFTHTKSRQTYSVPLHPKLAVFLREKQARTGDAGFVLPRLRLDSITIGFSRAAKRAKIPKARFHDIRGSLATHLMKRGIPIQTAQRILGHRSINTTAKYYYAGDEDLRVAMEEL